MSALGFTENAKGDNKKFEIWCNSRDEVFIVQVGLLILAALINRFNPIGFCKCSLFVSSRLQHQRLKHRGWTRSAKCWRSSSKPAEVSWKHTVTHACLHFFFSAFCNTYLLSTQVNVSDASQQKSSDSAFQSPASNNSSISLRSVFHVLHTRKRPR